MKSARKLMFWVLFGSSMILILAIGLLIFVINNDGITRLEIKETSTEQNNFKTQKTSPEFENGKKIFTADCIVCHPRNSIINTWKMKTGLIDEMGIEYFKNYITNQDSLTRINDPYARKLKEEYSNLANSHNFEYSLFELTALIKYIETEI